MAGVYTIPGAAGAVRGDKLWHIARDTPVTVVTTFMTWAGEERVVISFDKINGLLHIESWPRLRLRRGFELE